MSQAAPGLLGRVCRTLVGLVALALVAALALMALVPVLVVLVLVLVLYFAGRVVSGVRRAVLGADPRADRAPVSWNVSRVWVMRAGSISRDGEAEPGATRAGRTSNEPGDAEGFGGVGAEGSEPDAAGRQNVRVMDNRSS